MLHSNKNTVQLAEIQHLIAEETVMWVNHIGEIAIGAFVFLICAHFALHLFFKMQKRKQNRKPKQRTPNQD